MNALKEICNEVVKDAKCKPIHLKCLPPVKNTQLKCALTGGKGFMVKEVNNSNINDTDEELVSVVVLVRCPCCKKNISKDVVSMKKSENNAYYHSFVENSIPGILKFSLCNKCDKTKFTVIK